MVENDTFRTAFFTGGLFGMRGNHMHYFRRQAMFKGQANTAKGVTDMFAVVTFKNRTIRFLVKLE
jgi:hypothetical protein